MTPAIGPFRRMSYPLIHEESNLLKAIVSLMWDSEKRYFHSNQAITGTIIFGSEDEVCSSSNSKLWEMRFPYLRLNIEKRGKPPKPALL